MTTSGCAFRKAAALVAGISLWAVVSSARSEEPAGSVVCLKRASDTAETLGRQFFAQNDLNLNPDETYTLTFWARSPQGISLKISGKVSQPPWASVGTPQKVDVTPQWQKFELTVEPKGAVPEHTRLAFGFADPSPGEIQLADIRLRSASSDEAAAENLIKNGRFEDGLKAWYSEGQKPGQFQVEIPSPATAK